MHREMMDIYSKQADFEAEITILTAAEGGRSHPPHNYIRWDLGYSDRTSSDPIYMIWPVFLDQFGDPFPRGVPIEGTLTAGMFIVVREMVDFHKQRIFVGATFNCHEGKRVVARGIVTKLLALSA
jgi:hypothetical protein